MSGNAGGVDQSLKVEVKSIPNYRCSNGCSSINTLQFNFIICNNKIDKVI